MLDQLENVPGWCPSHKAVMMYELVLATQAEVIVEIGVYGGRSLFAQALAVKERGKGIVYGIDPYSNAACVAGNGLPDHEKHWTDADLETIYHDFLRNCHYFGVQDCVKLLRMTSQDASDSFTGSSIDILHIDGNHSEEIALYDARTYLPKVKPLGHIWVDDCNWDSVKPAVALIEEECDMLNECASFRLYQKRTSR